MSHINSDFLDCLRNISAYSISSLFALILWSKVKIAFIIDSFDIFIYILLNELIESKWCLLTYINIIKNEKSNDIQKKFLQ